LIIIIRDSDGANEFICLDIQMDTISTQTKKKEINLKMAGNKEKK